MTAYARHPSPGHVRIWSKSQLTSLNPGIARTPNLQVLGTLLQTTAAATLECHASTFKLCWHQKTGFWMIFCNRTCFKTVLKPSIGFCDFKFMLCTHRPRDPNYFTSSDPHRDIILKHIRHKFWHSFCPSVSRFHQNYPLLLVPSPGSGSNSDHCDLSSQTDSTWLSLCLVQHNFRRPGVSRRLGAWKLRFEKYKTIWLS